MDRKPVEGLDVFFWPETHAFLKRLGVDLDGSIRHVVITIPLSETVSVTITRDGTEAESDEHARPEDPGNSHGLNPKFLDKLPEIDVPCDMPPVEPPCGVSGKTSGFQPGMRAAKAKRQR